MLSNPFWFALQTEHARFAVGKGPILRYPADVIPFAGLEHPRVEQLLALHELLAPEEKVFVVADRLPEVAGLSQIGELPGLQMHFGRAVPQLDSRAVEIQKLGPDDVPAMISLTDIAFPGFFRERTYQLGFYFGVHRNGRLVAMAGERISLPGLREISAVCTHPEHTGNGYATVLIEHMLRFHAEHGLRSFLHVAAENLRAVSLYMHLGFAATAPMHFRQLQRVSQ